MSTTATSRYTPGASDAGTGMLVNEQTTDVEGARDVQKQLANWTSSRENVSSVEKYQYSVKSPAGAVPTLRIVAVMSMVPPAVTGEEPVTSVTIRSGRGWAPTAVIGRWRR